MMRIILPDMDDSYHPCAMRKSKDEKAASHERIVGVAARQIRERGTDQAGVAEIMHAAGLTHGGFYKHFDSRDELIDEAVALALSENELQAEQLLASADGDPMAAFADWYVTTAHRDTPGTGCGVAALGPDVSRIGGAAQEAYRDQVDHYLAHLQTLIGGPDPDSRRDALITLSTMVGALVIARGLGRTERSDELLDIVRQAIRERRLLTG
jgi:TetR/AcrR family transcriptional repressor of nem operon